MCALVMTNDILNSKADKGCLDETLYYGFSVGRDMYDCALYFGYVWNKIFLMFFIPDGATLDKELLFWLLARSDGHTIENGPRVCKIVQWGCCCSSHPLLRMAVQSLANCADPSVLLSIRNTMVNQRMGETPLLGP